jgi:hypothetical protein
MVASGGAAATAAATDNDDESQDCESVFVVSCREMNFKTLDPRVTGSTICTRRLSIPRGQRYFEETREFEFVDPRNARHDPIPTSSGGIFIAGS